MPLLLSRTRLLFYLCPSVGQFSIQWEGVAQSFERKHATQTVDRFGRSVGFGRKQILEVLVLGRHKCPGPDDTGIREIPGGDNGVVEGNAYFHVRPPKPSPKTRIDLN